MATHSSIFAWKFPWTENQAATVHGVTKSRTQLKNSIHSFGWIEDQPSYLRSLPSNSEI